MVFSRAGSGRMGITVSRKVGGAVVRNRVKRWIRECFRRRADGVPRPGWTSSWWRGRRPRARATPAICRELAALARRLGTR